MQYFPLNINFYEDSNEKGLSAEIVYKKIARYKKHEMIWFVNPSKVEYVFRVLINFGVLRREVDGQGLTSKVRLTPLGSQIIKDYPNLINKRPNFIKTIKTSFYLAFYFK